MGSRTRAAPVQSDEECLHTLASSVPGRRRVRLRGDVPGIGAASPAARRSRTARGTQTCACTARNGAATTRSKRSVARDDPKQRHRRKGQRAAATPKPTLPSVRETRIHISLVPHEGGAGRAFTANDQRDCQQMTSDQLQLCAPAVGGIPPQSRISAASRRRPMHGVSTPLCHALHKPCSIFAPKLLLRGCTDSGDRDLDDMVKNHHLHLYVQKEGSGICARRN